MILKEGLAPLQCVTNARHLWAIRNHVSNILERLDLFQTSRDRFILSRLSFDDFLVQLSQGSKPLEDTGLCRVRGFSKLLHHWDFAQSFHGSGHETVCSFLLLRGQVRTLNSVEGFFCSLWGNSSSIIVETVNQVITNLAVTGFHLVTGIGQPFTDRTER